MADTIKDGPGPYMYRLAESSPRRQYTSVRGPAGSGVAVTTCRTGVFSRGRMASPVGGGAAGCVGGMFSAGGAVGEGVADWQAERRVRRTIEMEETLFITFNFGIIIPCLICNHFLRQWAQLVKILAALLFRSAAPLRG
jgi:hypothetical protein